MSVSVRIAWNLIVLTFSFLILNQPKFYLVQKTLFYYYNHTIFNIWSETEIIFFVRRQCHYIFQIL